MPPWNPLGARHMRESIGNNISGGTSRNLLQTLCPPENAYGKLCTVCVSRAVITQHATIRRGIERLFKTTSQEEGIYLVPFSLGRMLSRYTARHR